MGAQGQSTLRSPRWTEQGQLLPVWRSKRKGHSYGHYSRFALNRLYLLVTSWSLLCRGSIVQLAKCEFLFWKFENWQSFFRNNLPPTRAHWCSWILVSTRLRQLITSSKVLFFLVLQQCKNFLFSCWASICDWCWMGSNWSLCCDLCFSLDSIEW